MTPTSFINLPFVLHGTRYTCDAHVDSTEFPCLVFVCFRDAALVAAYGEELTIKTDFDSLVPRSHEWAVLTIVRQAILDALLLRPEWMTERIRCMPLRSPATIFKQRYLTGHTA